MRIVTVSCKAAIVASDEILSIILMHVAIYGYITRNRGLSLEHISLEPQRTNLVVVPLSSSHDYLICNSYYNTIVCYALLTNVQEMTSLRHGCTRIAECLEPTTNESTRVTLKKIIDKQNDLLFDFHQVKLFHV